jgi:asparagine synthase (glutamine-hydrolysing)
VRPRATTSEPIADPVCVPLHFVSRMVRDSGVKVVHVGEGADEIFAGYPTYVTAHSMMQGPWRRMGSMPGPLRSLIGAVGSEALGSSPRHEIHAEALARLGERDSNLWWGGAVAFYERGLRRVTTPALRAQLNGSGPAQVVRTSPPTPPVTGLAAIWIA